MNKSGTSKRDQAAKPLGVLVTDGKVPLKEAEGSPPKLLPATNYELESAGNQKKEIRWKLSTCQGQTWKSWASLFQTEKAPPLPVMTSLRSPSTNSVSALRPEEEDRTEPPKRSRRASTDASRESGQRAAARGERRNTERASARSAATPCFAMAGKVE